jgi:hypothetical protein
VICLLAEDCLTSERQKGGLRSKKFGDLAGTLLVGGRLTGERRSLAPSGGVGLRNRILRSPAASLNGPSKLSVAAKRSVAGLAARSGRYGKVTKMTPGIHLKTGFVLDEHGRIRSTREPEPAPGPLFTLVRSASSCAWALRADVPGELAADLARLAGEEALI